MTETIERSVPHGLIGALNAAVERQRVAIAPLAVAMVEFRERLATADVARGAQPLPLVLGPLTITTRQALDHLDKLVRNAQQLTDLDCVMLVAELGNLVEHIAAEHDRRYPGAAKPAKPCGDA
jgi:phosphopantothenoylcysteine synthetase/decarboxylase